MLCPQAFALVHLAIILALLGWAAASARRARTEPFSGRRSGARYRRVSTAELMRRLRLTDLNH